MAENNAPAAIVSAAPRRQWACVFIRRTLCVWGPINKSTSEGLLFLRIIIARGRENGS
ncbi:hypothetical protein ETAE_1717 [Edwardsiella piscicida]|uniref:Uncharacterized protein n=1 Tax=Edwardsiella piscicida TaxID=1263550 RepID=A0AAU8P376_EDWPI|nr:hypothetical protein ETAE_1717 [Edwardsiella tarda EIB202]